VNNLIRQVPIFLWIVLNFVMRFIVMCWGSWCIGNAVGIHKDAIGGHLAVVAAGFVLIGAVSMLIQLVYVSLKLAWKKAGRIVEEVDSG